MCIVRAMDKCKVSCYNSGLHCLNDVCHCKYGKKHNAKKQCVKRKL